MTPRTWLYLAALLAAPSVQAQTTPVPYEDPEYSEYQDEGAYEDAAPQEDAVPTAPTAPPELPAENPTPRPFAGAVWVNGHWFWDGDEWRYNPGTWIAPMAGYRFINGYWEQDSQGWRWVSGGWARLDSNMVEIPVAPSSETLSTVQAPPPVRVEAAPPAPAPDLVWTPGYWYWTGATHVWVDGAWVAPPQPNLVYVSPRWVRRGPSWFFSCGGWAVRGSVRVSVPVYRHASVRVSWGHPYYFAHTWRRYPVVRYYDYRVRHHYRSHDYGHRRHDYGYRRPDYGYRRYDSGPRRHDSGPRRYDSGDRSPPGNRYRSRDDGSRNHDRGGWSGPRNRDHSASPGNSHQRNRDRRRD
ncbi:hypothetical protein [Pyxidicoccus xibeiensis]|uniref:hypothetical protein n=1 Tax=Pyxidicoccus xibeiensis TaxID=2906759 RepID=UPI0020A6FC63|nr:hypothetical protein [Pyxidicoccus xibeiensis]MCP3139141.1 hypothetical protein [Pyxidicoccus xibeiensis]